MFLSMFYSHFEKKLQNHIISIKINIFETVSKSAQNVKISGGLFCIQLDEHTNYTLYGLKTKTASDYGLVAFVLHSILIFAEQS